MWSVSGASLRIRLVWLLMVHFNMSITAYTTALVWSFHNLNDLGYTFKTVYVWFSHTVSNLLARWIFLKSTFSPTANVTDLAFLFLLAYSPILSSLFGSSLLTCLSALVGLLVESTDGKSLCGVWQNISCAGGILVMACGGVLRCSRKFSISCFQSFPLAWEHCMAFLNVLLKCSTSPLVEG